MRKSNPTPQMKQAALWLALAALSLLSCSRTFDSKTPAGADVDPPPTPTNIQIALIDNGAVVSWSVFEPTAVAAYRIYVSDNGLTGEYLLSGSTTNTTFTLTGLVSGREYYVSIASISESGFEGTRSTPARAGIGAFSMTINNNNEFTNRRNVSVNFFLSAGIGRQVRLSENPSFSGAVWSAYAGLKNFELSDGDGSKSVYAQLEFDDGSTLNAPLKDTIILDTRAVIDSVRNDAGGAQLTGGDTVLFRLYTTETRGDATVRFGGQTLSLFDDGTNGDQVTDDAVYTRLFIVPQNVEVTDAQVVGTFVDAAGNRADDALDVTLLNLANSPTPVTLSALAISESEIRLLWTQSSAVDFASYRVHRGLSSNVTESDQLVTTVSSVASTNYTDANLSQNTTYFYRVYVYDNTN
ncbi:MAG TPA: fibronectin type III domain-containing protein, partial [candidate division Zixibacteria bacterium]|nr:fibronectin type III domain-containing protein [candidate division Zixibacteria bacterium]